MRQDQFPFGQPLQKVQQKETSPDKEVFVLGVYASAVHAKWLNPDGSVKVQALAIASEPEIFWRGENAKTIIAGIKVPKELGSLLPTNENLNGPSGKALDNLFLKPLGFRRDKAWLCDLLPESRVNSNQKKAVEIYNDLVRSSGLNLPEATIPDFDESEIKKNAFQRKDDTYTVVKSCRIQAGLSNGLILVQSTLDGGSRFTTKAFCETQRPIAIVNPFQSDLDLPAYNANREIILNGKKGLSKFTELKEDKIITSHIFIIKSKDDYSVLENLMTNKQNIKTQTNSTLFD